MTISWTTISDVSNAPLTPGVYMYMDGNKPIYIGKAINLRARLKSHAQNAKHDSHERAIQDNSTSIRYTETDTDFLAILLEAKLIKKHLPTYNRALRDDKSYLYIVIDTNDTYPKPRLLRARDLNSKYKLTNKNYKLKTFGPFPSTALAEGVLRTIRRLIPFCQQKSVGKLVCFYHHLGLCNPCPSQIEKLPIPQRNKLTKQYKKQIRQVIKILEGNIEPVLKALNKELEKASEKEQYEQALKLRDKIERFVRTISTHSFSNPKILEYSTSESDLADLQQILNKNYELEISLHRVECYDASTWQLKNSVVSMVVAIVGQITPGEYRRFKIKNPRSRSDFDMLEEALDRRLHNKTWDKPDLLVIDGGRPQLRKLQPILDKIKNPPLMIGLAKHPDKIVVLVKNEYITINLDKKSGALRLLQRLRDEAHRFANSYRKTLEQKQKKV